jgi:hypothetical protein
MTDAEVLLRRPEDYEVDEYQVEATSDRDCVDEPGGPPVALGAMFIAVPLGFLSAAAGWIAGLSVPGMIGAFYGVSMLVFAAILFLREAFRSN